MRLTPDTAGSFVLSKVGHDFAQDPYPDYTMLREHAPLCRQPDGSFVLSRYDDVRAVLTDAARFSSDKRVDFSPKFGDGPLYEHHTTSLVFNDPPYHARVRKLLQPFFAAQTLRRMEESVSRMVDDLLGVPRGEREPLREWAAQILGGLEPVRTPEQMTAGNRAVEEFKAYLHELIAHKRANPSQSADIDILWALIQAADAGNGLTELEIIHNSIFMLNAGHDTTTSLISNGIDLLLRFPEQFERLRQDRSLRNTAIEEMLRYESPLQIGNRRAIVEAEIQGQLLPAGSFFHLAIASANRDRRVFPDPDRFDVGREPNKHLAFGHGIHFCAGNAVARMEARVAFDRLIERFPGMRRAGPTVRPDRSRLRVIDELRVELRR